MRTMQAKDYIAVAQRYWWVLVLSTVLITGFAVWSSFTAESVYRSTGTIYVSLPVGSTPAELSQGSLYTQNQMESYAALVGTSVVLDPVIKELDLPLSARDLSQGIDAEATPGTVLLNITAHAGSPEQAQEIAVATANSFIVRAKELAPPNEKGKPSVDFEVVEDPQGPGFPVAPNKRRNIAAGLFAGLVLGYLLALVWHLLDTRIKSVEDLKESTDDVVLTELPRTGTPEQLGGRGSAYGTAMERLRTGLDFLEVDSRPLLVTITSATAGEGKTTVAVNLARSCADAGQRVLLIDADLRRPRVHEAMGIDGAVGLTSVLAGHVPFDEAVQRSGRDDSLFVLASGQIPPNPSKLLSSTALADLLAEAKQRFELVIIDTPPILPVLDSAVIARQLSGALVVVKIGQVRSGDVATALERLDDASARVLGLVANAVAGRDFGPSTYYYSVKQQITGTSATSEQSRLAVEDN